MIAFFGSVSWAQLAGESTGENLQSSVDIRPEKLASNGRRRSNATEMAVVIAEWNFGVLENQNQDSIPDNWKRVVDRRHPRYIQCGFEPRRIQDEEKIRQARRVLSKWYLAWKQKKAPWEIFVESVPVEVEQFLEQSIADPCLVVKMDSGDFELQSPLYNLDSSFTYALEVQMASEQLEHYNARVELVLQDDTGRHRQIESTPYIGSNETWSTFRIQPFDLDHWSLDRGRIRIVAERKNKRAFAGTLKVDRIRLWKMPKLEISLGRELHLFKPGEPIEMNCKASGLQGTSPKIVVTVQDKLQNEVFSQFVEMESTASEKSMAKSGKSPSDTARRMLKATGGKPAGDQMLVSTISTNSSHEANSWRGAGRIVLPNLPSGYYTVNCEMPQRLGQYRFIRSTGFLIEPNSVQARVNRKFGWTIDHRQWTEPALLPELLGAARIGAAKVPVWTDYEITEDGKLLAWLTERFADLDISSVGVIGLPPPTQIAKFQNPEDLTLANMLNQTSVWQLLLQPIISRVTLRLSMFQIGWDDERELTDNPKVTAGLQALGRQLRLYSSEAKLVVPWNGMIQTPDNGNSIADLFQLRFSPSLISNEIAAVGDRSDSQSPIWLSIELNQNTRNLKDQVIELTRLVTEVTRSNIDQVWFDVREQSGNRLLVDHRQPGKLFLPFKTLIQSLAGLNYQGKFTLPNKSMNQYFTNGSRSVMILFDESLANGETRIEQLFFGDSIKAMDLWGNSIPIETVETEFGKEQKIPVTNWPLIVYDLDPHVASWRLGFEVVDPEVETVLGAPTNLQLSLTNTTQFNLRGKIDLIAPTLVSSQNEPVLIDTAAEAISQIEMPLSLRPNAGSRELVVRFDASIDNGTRNRFSILRSLRVGLKDIQIEVVKNVDAAGNLIINLKLINKGDLPANFDCMLIMPDRPRQRIQFVNAISESNRVILVSNAKALAGASIWLRCQEVGSNRVLNQRIDLPEEDQWDKEFNSQFDLQ